MVTEKPFYGSDLWLVSAEWRGGHDRRVIRLQEVFGNKSAAQARWDELTPERHNKLFLKPEGFDAGFIRHQIRHFVEVK